MPRVGADVDAAVPAISSSFGIAYAAPLAPPDADGILANADAALYAAKRGGRDRVAIWSDEQMVVGAPMHVDGVLTVSDAAPVEPAQRSARCPSRRRSARAAPAS